tara:strand:- start:1307 stop:5860 length:4554 start_codon:yes stop_codon:yes gene_type:complete
MALDRATQHTVHTDIFGNITKEVIKVGWIDPDKGFVDGFDLCAANDQAKKDPGTVFIFQDGNHTIRYLNINEVNKLDAADTLPQGDPCKGVNEKKICGIPRINIYGGGGIGALGNAVIGRDGSILAVDVVRGGHGYAYPPQVDARDDCDYGSGAVFEVVLGEVADAWQYYDQASDYEEYQLCENWGFTPKGRMYGPNGEDLGEWNPAIAVDLGVDPIRAEIMEYERKIRDVSRKPWFNTRKRRPNRMFANDENVIPSYNKVTDACFKEAHRKLNIWPADGGWGPWMNKYAISPKPPSNARGTDYAGILFTMEWDELFPVTGEYKIKGLCDNRSQVYIDGQKVLTPGVYTGAQLNPPVKRRYEEGVHNIKVELYNIPIVQTVLEGTGPTDSDMVTFKVSSSARYANGFAIPELGINFKKKYRGKQINETVTKKVQFGKPYTVLVTSDQSKKGVRLRTKGKRVLEMEDDTDMDWTDVVCSASHGKFIRSPDPKEAGGFQLISSNRCYFIVDKPEPKQIIKGPPKNQSETLKHPTVHENAVFDTIDWMGKANRQLWRTNVYSRGGFLNEKGVSPFDTSLMLNDNPYAGTHRIEWPNVKIPVDGAYTFHIAVDDTVTLYLGDQIKIVKQGFVGDTDTSTGEYKQSHFIKQGTYTLVADLYQKPGGRFGYGTGAATPSGGSGDIKYHRLNPSNNPIKVTDGGKKIKLKDSGGPDTNAIFKIVSGNGTFSSDGRRLNGTGSITLELSWNDKKNTAGRAVQSIQIGNKTWSVSGNEVGSQTRTVELAGVVKGINPMALAINISGSMIEKEVVVPYSWCENPMGVALGINSPEPVPPQEIPPPQEGRCPPNPIWSTRFPNAVERWYPVTGEGSSGRTGGQNAYSPFTNRYAISPIKPLDLPGTDNSGVTFSNTWPLDIAYDGFYAVRGTCDNRGKVFIDGRQVYTLKGFKTERPLPKKVWLKQGTHTIGVEVWNKPVKRSFKIRKNIFRTMDWRGGPDTVEAGEVDVTFTITTSAWYANGISIPELGISEKKKYKGKQLRKTITKKVKRGKLYEVITSSDQTKEGIRLRTMGNNVLQMEEDTDMDWTDLVCTASQGKWNVGPGNTATFIVGANRIFGGIESGTTKNGVTYTGPRLFGHVETGHYEIKTRQKMGPARWGTYMNAHSVSPWFPDLFAEDYSIVGVKVYTWSNVDFPENGTYSFKFAADNNASVFIDETLITGSLDHQIRMDYGHWKTGMWHNVQLTKGKHTVRVECLNIDHAADGGDYTFINNPTGFALIIKFNDTIQRTDMTSWAMNPVCASAILIAPPCPKKISGRGVVKEIIPTNPGWYPPPETPPGDPPEYDVTLELDRIEPPDTTNYNCEEDEIVIEPSNGAEAKLVCGPFGSIPEIIVTKPGRGFTTYPDIYIASSTGIRVPLVPTFRIIRTPVDPTIRPEELLQVTDLAGIKKTGYYNGKPYYGAVFYENGIKYAGWYETPGQLVQIYDTLQESIDAQVTTPPSAILRQGSDVTSNDPKLDIPGTPDTLT